MNTARIRVACLSAFKVFIRGVAWSTGNVPSLASFGFLLPSRFEALALLGSCFLNDRKNLLRICMPRLKCALIGRVNIRFDSGGAFYC